MATRQHAWLKVRFWLCSRHACWRCCVSVCWRRWQVSARVAETIHWRTSLCGQWHCEVQQRSNFCFVRKDKVSFRIYLLLLMLFYTHDIMRLAAATLVYVFLEIESRQLVMFACWRMIFDIDGLVQERRNSSALAMELCLSCTNPLIYIYAPWKENYFIEVLLFNSLVHGRCGCNHKVVIFKLISSIHVYILSIFCEIALRWMLQDLTDD